MLLADKIKMINEGDKFVSIEFTDSDKTKVCEYLEEKFIKKHEKRVILDELISDLNGIGAKRKEKVITKYLIEQGFSIMPSESQPFRQWIYIED